MIGITLDSIAYTGMNRAETRALLLRYELLGAIKKLGLDKEKVHDIGVGCLLHDLGLRYMMIEYADQAYALILQKAFTKLLAKVEHAWLWIDPLVFKAVELENVGHHIGKTP